MVPDTILFPPGAGIATILQTLAEQCAPFPLAEILVTDRDDTRQICVHTTPEAFADLSRVLHADQVRDSAESPVQVAMSNDSPDPGVWDLVVVARRRPHTPLAPPLPGDMP
jgi:hypothetical protein